MNRADFREKLIADGMTDIGVFTKKLIQARDASGNIVYVSPLNESLTSEGWEQHEISYFRQLKNGCYGTVNQTLLVRNVDTAEEEVREIGQVLHHETLAGESDAELFLSDLRAFLETYITNNVILKYNIDKADHDDEFAIVTAYSLADNVVSSSVYFVYRYNGGAFSFYPYA